jgi:recombinational DNA repair ATPase RecF
MIQIETIAITELRGIRDLTLELKGKSFLIWGHNGSGKSGVVDAIDFALTGNILRLSGSGLGGITLAKHGPHVHKRDDPSAAQVELTLRDTESGKTAVLKRDIKTRTYTLTPDLPEIREYVELAQQHPELTLSRREIIKYIVAEPGRRAAEVQALLKLDRLDETRKLLRTVDNAIASQLKDAGASLTSSESRLRTHLDLEDSLVSNVLIAVNAHRTTLDLAPLTELTATTMLDAGVDSESSEEPFNRTSMLRDLRALRTSVVDTAALNDAGRDLGECLQTIEGNVTGFIDMIETVDLVTMGLGRLADASCPLCGLAWESADILKEHLETRISEGNDAKQLKANIESLTTSIIGQFDEVIGKIQPVEAISRREGSLELAVLLRSWSDDLTGFKERLRVTSAALIERPRLEENPARVPDKLAALLSELTARIEAHPDQSAKDSARGFLAIAQDRWKAVQAARSRAEKATAVRASAKAIYGAYCGAVDDALIKLYHEVEDEFAQYYREINADDESAFKAQLEPSAGKLELSVDFYGQGMFPPAAYHSEGHQDGMGICLYLALVKRILGDNFRFAVLDDVLMSIDSNHRRQFCQLLKSHFPKVQFIITTHDRVWAEQIRRSGLIARESQVRFHGWTVAGGPVVDLESEIWDRIDASLQADDISAAAARLRRHLESILSDLAVNLRGNVPYKPEGGADFGELISSVESAYGRLLAKAAKAANGWGDDASKLTVDTAKSELSARRILKDEQAWAVNPAVHYNEWENLQKVDFKPVVDAWKQFLELFQCKNPACESLLYVGMKGQEQDSLRCKCGTVSINLQSK